MYSVRRRLMLVLAAGFAVLILGGGVYVSDLLGDQATDAFDMALLAKAGALMGLTEQEAGNIEFDYSADPDFERDDKPDYFQYWLDNGKVIYRTSQLQRLGRDLPRLESIGDAPAIRDAPLPDGRPGRLVQWAFTPSGPGEDDSEQPADAASGKTLRVVLVVARGRGRLDTLLGTMRLVIFGVGAIATLLAVVLVWRALAAGFRPLASIATQVQVLDAHNLSVRVRLARTPQELQPIVDQLNALLERLGESFERARRFTGNVAHELRTPIAELRALAEVGSKWPEDQASIVRFFDDVTDIAGRMETVIADLLLLARCQAGVEVVVSSPTNLKQIIASTWSRLTAGSSYNGLTFRLDLPEDLVIQSDPGKLEIVFANVLGNALSYSRPEGEILCAGIRNGDRFQLDISNPAEPLGKADLERLAEPFWRKDEARSSAAHAGLGLSVVSALAALLRLEVGFTQDQNGTFTVRMAGPALENT
ncbi:MAG: ATP-binding protein [Planctomycetota bacterium]|nr:ATP-binding protein [Planctomycetota bacterium]